MKTNALRSILRRRRVIASVAALVLLAGAAAAGAERRGPAPANGAWKTECGACHLAYPPHLLPARSWRAIMSGLDKHFGTDASLDPAAAAEIAAFLERHGGRDRGPTPSLRITETPWFQHEHRKIGAAIWARPAIKGPANCSACHAGADRGDYDDDTVRIPR